MLIKSLQNRKWWYIPRPRSSVDRKSATVMSKVNVERVPFEFWKNGIWMKTVPAPALNFSLYSGIHVETDYRRGRHGNQLNYQSARSGIFGNSNQEFDGVLFPFEQAKRTRKCQLCSIISHLKRPPRATIAVCIRAVTTLFGIFR